MSDALHLQGVTKSYGPTVALSDASFSVKAGTVHALLGENGAGKSTVVKILSGLVRPDGGSISLFGEDVQIAHRGGSSELGIETAFQEIPLINDLTVAENLLLPDLPLRFGFLVKRRAMMERVRALQSELEIADIDPRALVSELDLSQRQKVEIARAISRNPRLLILDEPTAALSRADVEWLGRRIAELKVKHTTIVLVTHRMPEVRDLCSDMSILRNGTHVGSFSVGEISDEQVFRHIMGRSVEVSFPSRSVPKAKTDHPPLIQAEGITAGRKVRDISMSLNPGEIVGVACLQGMGQVDFFNALFGVEQLSAGRLLINGEQAHFGSPANAIEAGLALVPEDRKIQGLALNRSGVENATLPIVEDFSSFGILQAKQEQNAADQVFASVNLHPRALYQTPSEFSGGNQQKIVLAKWLMTQCRSLLVFDPTRGVDIGTKHEIYALLRGFAETGGGVLFHSTEVPELIGLCDRILVIYDGRVVADVPHSEATEEGIGALMMGAFPQSLKGCAA
ncbi:sugar ABC transporter ATP-binding protein [Mariluticola halotolerans]|uniref:sugar ABC transporter ATP-binding protein n=1 Tax=Mariluticola halotolerans TaxID=2909283 RepID=UPI0026E18D77|nr:sugar ABC transporter ATP-binding protein [Mariluticola halotolerans]UJQ94850.1 sugar ABC transporter ATP-binding protein [Mariluticola halotolerans]